MAITVNDNFQNNSPKSLDAKYTKFVGGAATPYASVSEANSLIPSAYRSVGLTVLIDTGAVNKEHWYKEGIADVNLVVKGETTASNGLTATNNNVTWGGILAQTTEVLGDNRFLSIGTSSSPLNNFFSYSNNMSFLGGMLGLSYERYLGNANYTPPNNRSILELDDTALTANRTITIPNPSPIVSGAVLIVYNTGNNASFFYQFNVPVTDIKTDTTFTQIDHRTCYVLIYDSTLQWVQILKF